MVVRLYITLGSLKRPGALSVLLEVETSEEPPLSSSLEYVLMSSLYTQDTTESLLQIVIWTKPVSGQLVQALKRVLQGSQDGV